MILLANAFFTLYMVGVIWFVQLVHYPLFDAIAADSFSAFEQRHQNRTFYVVAFVMLGEAATSAWLVWQRPAFVPPVLAWVGLGLTTLMFLSTFLIQVPCHESLVQRFDPAVHHWLVLSNWIRTIGWTLHGLVVLKMIELGLPKT